MLGIVGLLSAAACSLGGPTNVIKIGVDLPLNGEEGRAGTPTLNGVEFYVSQHPTIDGFTVIVDARDDAVSGAHDPVTGVGNVRAMAADAALMAVIGPFDSSMARAEIPVANVAGIALISPSASSRCLTKDPYLPAGLSPTHVEISCKAAGLPGPKDLRPSGTNNFFRLATSDDLQGPAAADYAYKTLHLLRVAVLSDHEAYGQALAAGFRTRFLKLGGSVVSHLDYDPSASIDLSAFLRHARSDGAQGVYFGGVTANHGCVLRAQMAAVFGTGTTAPYLGGDGIAEDPDCVRNAGAYAAGIYATVPAADPGNIAAATPVIAAFKRQHPNAADYGAYTIAAYDAAGVLYAALDRAIKAAGGKRPARASVIAELAATTAYAGATGAIGFDAAGDSTLRLVTVFESTGSDPAAPWTDVGSIDYSAVLPF